MLNSLLRIRKLFEEGDTDSDQCLKLQEFQRLVENSETMAICLKDIEVPRKEALHIFQELDVDGSGSLTPAELLHGLAKIKSCIPSSWDAVAARAGVDSLSTRMSQIQEEVSRIATRQEQMWECVVTQLKVQEDLLRRLDAKEAIRA